MTDTFDHQLAALLRTYPFFDYDRARVALRAYFLGERSGDSLSNWFNAETIESFDQANTALVFPTGALDFLREYELVDHIRFLTNEPRKKGS